MTLKKNIPYDLNSLKLTGWTDGDGSGHDGYNVADYFGAESRYLGPDAHGIEPVFDDESAFWGEENAPMTKANAEWIKRVDAAYAPLTVGTTVYPTREAADAVRAKIATIVAANPGKPAYQAQWAMEHPKRAKAEGWAL